jgi:hypothetical protein
MTAGSMTKLSALLVAVLAVSHIQDTSAARAEGTVPSGVFLWYSGSPGPPSDADCMALVDAVRPSVDKAEDWLWGRVPDRPSDALEFYLFVSEDRIETTFAAEGGL